MSSPLEENETKKDSANDENKKSSKLKIAIKNSKRTQISPITKSKIHVKHALRKTKSDTSMLASFNVDEINLSKKVSSPSSYRKTTTLFCIDPQVDLSFELKFVPMWKILIL